MDIPTGPKPFSPSSRTSTPDVKAKDFIKGEKVMDFAPFLILGVNGLEDLVYSNAACQSVLGYDPEELKGRNFLDLVAEEDRNKTLEMITGEKHRQDGISFENNCFRKDGNWINIKWFVQWDEAEQVLYCFGDPVASGFSAPYDGSRPADNASFESIAALEKRIIRLNMEQDIPILQVVDSLVLGIEELYPGAMCSIVRLQTDQRMRTYSAPNLPKEYADLVNDLFPGPVEGSCGTAIHFKRTTIVNDIEKDPLWEKYKGVAARFGLRACWSIPIYDSKGNILGAFGIYYRQKATPSASMLQTIERLASLIGLLIDNNETFHHLRLSNERYNLAAQATHDMIWDWDLQENEIFRNEDGLFSIYGFSTNDPIRRIADWVERIHPDDKERIKLKIGAIHEGNTEIFEAEYRFLRLDGKYAFIYDRGYIMRDASGKAIRVIGAAQDITELVRVSQMIRDSEERYRYLFNCNPLPTWIFDLETVRILEVNQTAVRHYGYSMEEFFGMTLFDLHPGYEHERVKGRITQQGKDEKWTYLRGEWQHIKKNGDLIHVETFSHKLMYKGSQAMLVLANDITQNIRLQTQLMEEKSARQQEIMKATIGIQEKERNEIGHELHDNVNQILTSAKLYLECVGLYDERKEEYRLTGYSLLNNGIEEIRRLSKSLSPPRLNDVGLIQSIKDILENMRVIQPMDVTFYQDGFEEDKVDDGLKITIYRIIQEQSTNVLKHAFASSFTIHLYRDLSCLVLKIGDNGQGFDTSSPRKGVGITNIINRSSIHQGKVDIESSPGNGCSLSIYFDCFTD
jgi:PAS domain S-box-containing protein